VASPPDTRPTRPLGGLACGSCGVERDGAADRDDWLITVRLGVLAGTTCPRCAGADGNRPSRRLDPVPGSTSAGPVELEISEHVIIRWNERVRPGLTLEAAEDDLVRQLATHAHWAQPDWLSEEELGGDRWLMIGSDVAFPVRGTFVVSCLVRSTLSPRGRRLATDSNHFYKRVRRAKERSPIQKWEGKRAKRNRKRDKSWLEEAS
jgi:hypothetical protein